MITFDSHLDALEINLEVEHLISFLKVMDGRWNDKIYGGRILQEVEKWGEYTEVKKEIGEVTFAAEGHGSMSTPSPLGDLLAPSITNTFIG